MTLKARLLDLLCPGIFLVPLVCYSVLHRPDQDVVAKLPLDGFQFLSAGPRGKILFSIPTVCEEHVCATTYADGDLEFVSPFVIESHDIFLAHKTNFRCVVFKYKTQALLNF